LDPSSRVADEPLKIDLPSGPWEPVNPDGRFRGAVTTREALRHSLNVPFVRIARWCGWRESAGRMRDAGLVLPADPPPAFSLGAVETTPLQLAGAYTVLASPGRRLEARPLRRVERPGGRRLHRSRPRSAKVTSPSAAWLVRHLMTDAVARGTARSVALEGLDVAAKTGTSSERRDAWLAGHSGGVVAVVWVGRDDGAPLGLTGASAAGPLWREFMDRAARARPPRRLPAPHGVVERCVDPRTGLLVGCGRRSAVEERFRREAQPPRKRFWRRDESVPVVR
jgi:membrane carboxypeptidase/penicillin-binding protein